MMRRTTNNQARRSAGLDEFFRRQIILWNSRLRPKAMASVEQSQRCTSGIRNRRAVRNPLLDVHDSRQAAHDSRPFARMTGRQLSRSSGRRSSPSAHHKSLVDSERLTRDLHALGVTRWRTPVPALSRPSGSYERTGVIRALLTAIRAEGTWCYPPFVGQPDG
jgi:hypothetical protein